MSKNFDKIKMLFYVIGLAAFAVGVFGGFTTIGWIGGGLGLVGAIMSWTKLIILIQRKRKQSQGPKPGYTVTSRS